MFCYKHLEVLTMESNPTINENNFFNCFSEDLFYEIFHEMSPSELLIMSRVSMIWKKMSDLEVLWRFHAITKWPDYVKIEDINWKEHIQANYNSSFFGSLNFYLGDLLTVCNNSINYLDPQKKSVVHEKISHKASINQLIIYDNKKANIKFITCATDGSLKMWDNQMNDVCLLDQHIHTRSVTCIESFSNTFFTGSQDLSLKVWELNYPNDFHKTYSLELIDELKGHKEAITCLQISRDSPDVILIFSGSRDKTIKIWKKIDDLQYQCIQTLKSHKSTVTSLKISTRANCLISGSVDKTIKIWNKQEDKFMCIQTLSNHSGTITSFVVDPYNWIFYSTALDGKIIGWKYCTINKKWIADSVNISNKTKINCLKFNRNLNGNLVNAIEYNQLYSLSSDGKATLWSRTLNSTALTLEKELNNLT